jgi:alkaline phosphatase D
LGYASMMPISRGGDMSKISALRIATLLLLTVAIPAGAAAPVVFTAVAAGDMTERSAILWTRVADGATAAARPLAMLLTAQVSSDPTFLSAVLSYPGASALKRDGTAKIEATGLASHRRYYYRFVAATGDVSPVGRFVTAPAPGDKVEVKFAFSGDADGRFRPYPSTQAFASLDLDFFIFLGDTIYETASEGSPPAGDPFADPRKALADYRRKYLENVLPLAPRGFASLKTMFASQGNYTLLDNHELGNRQFQSGGAPAGRPAGKGVDPADPANDVDRRGPFINGTAGFKALLRAYDDYEPIRERPVLVPDDPRSHATQRLYFAQGWGANCIFVNVDDRSYRDIRLAKPGAGHDDDTGPRADNPGREILGGAQLLWLERTLLEAERRHVTWKIVAISSPIDRIGGDGGKSWVGGYRAERNRLLKFIADHHIGHVVFLTTDDHLNRVNELTYAPDPADPSHTVQLPGAFTIVAGPLGAGGPDAITNHDFTKLKAVADTLANGEAATGIDPLGLDPAFPGLHSVHREGDPAADRQRSPIDFYSPDSFNYVVLDISPDGRTLSVDTWGIDSYRANTFPEPDARNVPRRILGFQIVARP